MKNSRKKVFITVFAVMMMFLFSTAGVSAAALNKTKLTLMKGETEVLQLTDTEETVKWSSSKKSVASVDQSGKVTARKKGTAVITARVGNNKYTCKVTVRQPVTSVKLNQKSISMTEGKSYTLKTTVKPSSANTKTVSWKSSNPAVVKVSSKGKLTAVSAGNAVITATAKDGSGKYASCKVTVKAPVSSDTSTLKLSSSSLSLTAGQSAVLKAITNDGAKVTWGSSDTSVVTVSGGTVTAKKAGSAIVACMRTDRSKTVYCKITVKEETTQTSAAGESVLARKLLNTLQKYSDQVKSDAAAGRVWSYSNSSGLAASTWSASLSNVEKNGIAYSNCALMVRWALRELGVIDSKNFWGTSGGTFTFRGNVKDQLLKHAEIIKVYKTPSQLIAEGNLLPGDICSWVGYQHTNVYAGNGKWYDSGRSSAVGSYKNGRFEFSSFGPASTVNMNSTTVGYIIRLK